MRVCYSSLLSVSVVSFLFLCLFRPRASTSSHLVACRQRFSASSAVHDAIIAEGARSAVVLVARLAVTERARVLVRGSRRLVRVVHARLAATYFEAALAGRGRPLALLRAVRAVLRAAVRAHRVVVVVVAGAGLGAGHAHCLGANGTRVVGAALSARLARARTDAVAADSGEARRALGREICGVSE